MQAEALSSELMLLVNDTTQYHQAEIDYWKQQCEELEIDLMLEENKILKFTTPTKSITPKRRSNF